MRKWIKQAINKSPNLGALAIFLLTVSTTAAVIQTFFIGLQVLDSIIAYFIKH